MEADLRTRLLAAAAVAALVGGRVSWVERPRTGGLPAITLTMAVDGSFYTHDGSDPLRSPRVQVDCWAGTHLGASQLASAVTAALESPTVVGTTKFGRAFVADSRDGGLEDMEGGGKVHRRSIDFIIWHEPV